jgi:hypothetical protein
MKKILALSVVAVLCAVVVLAGDAKHMGKMNGGTITKMDTAGKMMVVKDSAGTETTVYWNDTTTVSGDEMKEGAMVHWAGVEKDGKMWATKVHVGAMQKKM